MLRFALLLLVVANAGYLAWSQGWMASLGFAPEQQSEAYRLQQQVRPDALVLVAEPASPPDAPAPAMPAPSAPAAEPPALVAANEPEICRQAGPFDEAQVEVLRAALRQQALPADRWEFQPTSINGRWMVYLGKFSDAEALDKRRADLRSKKIDFDRAGGALDPGLSLGRFSNEEAATRELTKILRQGVRGARVVQERPNSTAYMLSLAAIPVSMRPQLEAFLKPSLAGKPLRPCEG